MNSDCIGAGRGRMPLTRWWVAAEVEAVLLLRRRAWRRAPSRAAAAAPAGVPSRARQDQHLRPRRDHPVGHRCGAGKARCSARARRPPPVRAGRAVRATRPPRRRGPDRRGRAAIRASGSSLARCTRSCRPPRTGPGPSFRFPHHAHPPREAHCPQTSTFGQSALGSNGEGREQPPPARASATTTKQNADSYCSFLLAAPLRARSGHPWTRMSVPAPVLLQMRPPHGRDSDTHAALTRRPPRGRGPSSCSAAPRGPAPARRRRCTTITRSPPPIERARLARREVGGVDHPERAEVIGGRAARGPASR